MYQIDWGSLDVHQFLSEYWQQQPLVLRDAFKPWHPLIEPDELAGLSLEEEVESRLIRTDQAGRYELLKGPFDESIYAELPEENWTLLVQALDHYLPEAADLLDAFAFIPKWRIDDLMVSYATPGGGVGPHYDNYDVFLIQASGTRRWELGDYESTASKRRDQAPVLLLENFEAKTCFDLSPGDMLYIPPQLAHNGVATSADCVTYSVGFRAPSYAEILHGVSDQIGAQLTEEQRYRDPKLRTEASSARISPESIEEIQQQLLKLLAQPELIEDWLGRRVSEPKYEDQFTPPEPDEVDDWLSTLDLNAGVQQIPGSRLCYSDTRLPTRLFANGETLEIAKTDQAWVTRLADTRYSGPIPDHASSKSTLRTLFTLSAIE